MQEFLPGLRWQPIPVHSVMGDDYVSKITLVVEVFSKL